MPASLTARGRPMVQITDTLTRQVDWADWLRRWDAQQSLYMTTRDLAMGIRQRRREAIQGSSTAEDWERWWQAVEAEPGLKELFAERERRFAWRDRKWVNAGLDFQVGALRDAGFRETDVIWQHFDNRVLMAVR